MDEKWGLKPSDVEFAITNGMDGDEYTGHDTSKDITLWVSSISDPGNDDIRDINHKDFDKYWGNACECVFISWDQKWIDINEYGVIAFKTIQEAKGWCISIGMVHNQNLAYNVGG
jgi:hypothetical protein